MNHQGHRLGGLQINNNGIKTVDILIVYVLKAKSTHEFNLACIVFMKPSLLDKQP